MSLDGYNNCHIVTDGADAIVNLYTTPSDNYNGLGWEVELPDGGLRYIPIVKVADNDYNPYKINAFLTIDDIEYQIAKSTLPVTTNVGGSGFSVGSSSSFTYRMTNPVWTRTFVVPKDGYYHFVSKVNASFSFGAKSDGWCWSIMATLIDDYALNATYQVGYKNGIYNDSKKFPPRSTSGFTRHDNWVDHSNRTIQEDTIFLTKGEHTATFWVAANGSNGDGCWVKVNPWNLYMNKSEQLHSFTVTAKNNGSDHQKITITTSGGGKYAPDGTYTIQGGSSQAITCDYGASVSITTESTTAYTNAGSLIVNGSNVRGWSYSGKAYSIDSVTNVLPTAYEPPSEGSQGEGSGGEGSGGEGS